MQDILQREPKTSPEPSQREGTVARTIEQQTATRGTLGIGIPGTISPATGLIKNSNSTWLNGRALAEDLPRLLDRPVRFANDANCFALSEATDGAAAGARVVFGVIIGTGTGGGVVIDRQVLAGANAIGGEWGHNPLPNARGIESPGPACYCGRSGCIETFLSGPALARDYPSTGSGQAAITAEEVAARAA
jgi:fructokinase